MGCKISARCHFRGSKHFKVILNKKALVPIKDVQSKKLILTNYTIISHPRSTSWPYSCWDLIHHNLRPSQMHYFRCSELLMMIRVVFKCRRDACRPHAAVNPDAGSHLIWLHAGCNGSGGSRSPQTSAATDTGPGTPRLLCSNPPVPPQTERWLLRSRLCHTVSLLPWKSAKIWVRGTTGWVFIDISKDLSHCWEHTGKLYTNTWGSDLIIW